MLISFSRELKRVVKPFEIDVKKRFFSLAFIGWGRRRYGELSRTVSDLFSMPYLCIEDGFIRSWDLGNSTERFSIVVDDVGIYYDATKPSLLENLLNTYDFSKHNVVIDQAKESMKIMLEYHISKYNHAQDTPESMISMNGRKRVLIVAQTKGDLSLRYGLGENFTTAEILNAAKLENPGADLYLKIHTDVLNGIKQSDIGKEEIPREFKIITEDVNPISLLKFFDKVYTKTSQMGFEALLLEKEVVCFGMPFYAGWGMTDDRIVCPRRKRSLNVVEIFAAAYILYPIYYHPKHKQICGLPDLLSYIVEEKNEKQTL